MKKDVEWLKEKVEEMYTHYSISNNFDFVSKREAITEISNLIDQLDEPQKPVIPQFVADWLEEAKDRKMTLYGAIHECPREVDYWLVDGDSSNRETFARAWLDGYEVEKEKKYYVLTRSNKLLLTKDDGVVRGTYQAYSWVRERDKEHYQLTEKEIKDYDERFWAFRKPVEELEE